MSLMNWYSGYDGSHSSYRENIQHALYELGCKDISVDMIMPLMPARNMDYETIKKCVKDAVNKIRPRKINKSDKLAYKSKVRQIVDDNIDWDDILNDATNYVFNLLPDYAYESQRTLTNTIQLMLDNYVWNPHKKNKQEPISDLDKVKRVWHKICGDGVVTSGVPESFLRNPNTDRSILNDEKLLTKELTEFTIRTCGRHFLSHKYLEQWDKSR